MRSSLAVVLLACFVGLHGPAVAQPTSAGSESEAPEETMEGEYWDQIECKSYNRAASRLRARSERVCLTRREWRQRELETEDALNLGERGANTEPPDGNLSRGF